MLFTRKTHSIEEAPAIEQTQMTFNKIAPSLIPANVHQGLACLNAVKENSISPYIEVDSMLLILNEYAKFISINESAKSRQTLLHSQDLSLGLMSRSHNDLVKMKQNLDGRLNKEMAYLKRMLDAVHQQEHAVSLLNNAEALYSVRADELGRDNQMGYDFRRPSYSSAPAFCLGEGRHLKGVSGLDGGWYTGMACTADGKALPPQMAVILEIIKASDFNVKTELLDDGIYNIKNLRIDIGKKEETQLVHFYLYPGLFSMINIICPDAEGTDIVPYVYFRPDCF